MDNVLDHRFVEDGFLGILKLLIVSTVALHLVDATILLFTLSLTVHLVALNVDVA